METLKTYILKKAQIDINKHNIKYTIKRRKYVCIEDITTVVVINTIT